LNPAGTEVSPSGSKGEKTLGNVLGIPTVLSCRINKAGHERPAAFSMLVYTESLQ